MINAYTLTICDKSYKINPYMTALVFYTVYTKNIYEKLLQSHAHLLPQSVKNKVIKFRRWQDRQAFIIGRLLIWKGLKQFNYADDCLGKLQSNAYGKPYIDPPTGKPIFFNVSHSGRYVICAFYQEEIGIDVEEIHPIEIDDFNSLFTPEERRLLSSSPSPLKDFFRLWTIKESVIKAEGKGLSIPLQALNVSEKGLVEYEKGCWHIKEIDLAPDYCCAIASRTRLAALDLQKVEFGF